MIEIGDGGFQELGIPFHNAREMLAQAAPERADELYRVTAAKGFQVFVILGDQILELAAQAFAHLLQQKMIVAAEDAEFLQRRHIDRAGVDELGQIRARLFRGLLINQGNRHGDVGAMHVGRHQRRIGIGQIRLFAAYSFAAVTIQRAGIKRFGIDKAALERELIKIQHGLYGEVAFLDLADGFPDQAVTLARPPVEIEFFKNLQGREDVLADDPATAHALQHGHAPPEPVGKFPPCFGVAIINDMAIQVAAGRGTLRHVPTTKLSLIHNDI
ncbi:MAG: hypothetical protein HOF27_09175 [Rhodospirillaceae bacterium]|nr:hypothetical protein [Rhodospirillaceae bacterium]MBT5299494.1 hypothetical protein [Rhodospirillaceae bacterium]MBT5515694.1 hypothetical protein [Rhodospirillaceae bacterium]MBT7511286.1 hypothetical protein [Rhodospirillaceae bacterium]